MEKVAFLPAVNASFVLPMISFVVVAIFGYRAFLFQSKG